MKVVAPLIKSFMVSKGGGLAFPCLVGGSGHPSKVSLSLGSVSSQGYRDVPKAPNIHLCDSPAQAV